MSVKLDADRGTVAFFSHSQPQTNGHLMGGKVHAVRSWMLKMPAPKTVFWISTTHALCALTGTFWAVVLGKACGGGQRGKIESKFGCMIQGVFFNICKIFIFYH